jgi:hypothetical protein
MTLEVPILEIRPLPVYQGIAPKAKHLQELGMNQSEIGRRLEVDRWTVDKVIRWLEGLKKQRERVVGRRRGSTASVTRAVIITFRFRKKLPRIVMIPEKGWGNTPQRRVSLESNERNFLSLSVSWSMSTCRCGATGDEPG